MKHTNNCIDGHCVHCGIKMVGHQTVEEWQAVVDKNRAWAKEHGKRKDVIHPTTCDCCETDQDALNLLFSEEE